MTAAKAKANLPYRYLALAIVVLAVIAAGWKGRTPNAEPNLDTLKHWTGIESFPVPQDQIKISAKGSAFTRELTAEFLATPQQIEEWRNTSTALTKAQPTTLANGDLHYVLTAQNGAQFAELTISADRTRVKIRTYWS